MQFHDFAGNTGIKQQLSQMEQSDRMPHAIIIEGAPGSGKHTLAHLLAQRAVCTAADQKPCGMCAQCLKAQSGNHPDIFTAQGGSGARSFHVDVIRAVRESAYILPNEAQQKVYVLEGADTMTDQAQNALLKILEEPPEYVLFILTCISSAGLLATVRSRAQTFLLEPPQDGEVQQDLAVVELAEKLAEAIAAPREYELIALTGRLTKDKDLLRAVLQRLVLIFRNACVYSVGSPGREVNCTQAKTLCERFTGSKLIAFMEMVQQAQRMLEQNANQTLLVTWLCAGLRTK